MEALESQLGENDMKDRRKSREREIDEDFESIFKTKVNQEHLMEKQKKPSKLNKELREAAFFAALE